MTGHGDFSSTRHEQPTPIVGQRPYKKLLAWQKNGSPKREMHGVTRTRKALILCMRIEADTKSRNDGARGSELKKKDPLGLVCKQAPIHIW